ncbi:hypothetical protein AQUCO_02600359v1 [Aquilegia coerulea]|uniref:Nuclear transcription factor Y subunit n=2 Tax=Aquilegia coerulea TaxID=218851 RepID=A0A2G5D8K7_AQUCA|nr:hypothetical protein AQUCO_02600359v1 [Aquilegia coerulea]
MSSSVEDYSSNSDNSRADGQHQHSESQTQSQSQSPASGTVHSNLAPFSAEYMMPPHLEVGHAVAPPAYPYPDPYYRSIFNPYGAQPMIHPHLMGIQAAVPLPSDAVEEPVYVNAKQYHGILRRRQSRAKAESENKMLKCRKVRTCSTPESQNIKPYLHESRHLHALRRARGCGGRFLNVKPDENEENNAASHDSTQRDTGDSNKQNSSSEKSS